MSVESDNNLPAPNWLSELELKREKRVKRRLGHEAGAGAPCLLCAEKCPGLDLHFWRKICKVCKCSKEQHDVEDDDIHNWAEFQLLGSRPNKIKTKIVLPGRNNEVELEWAPKGSKETIDKYLKSLPPDALPVKGSDAALARKQLLQKQMPIHDIDPGLCHELSDSEKCAMDKYIDYMKTNSVGVGKIMQFERLPQTIATTQTLSKLAPQNSTNLVKNLEDLAIEDQRELDAFFDTIPKPTNMATATKWSNLASFALDEPNQNYAPARHLANYAPSSLNITNEHQNPTNINNTIRDKYYEQNSNNQTSNALPSLRPQQGYQPLEASLEPTNVNIGPIHDLTYKNQPFIGHEQPILAYEQGVLSYEHGETGITPARICKKCNLEFNLADFVVFAERCGHFYHSECFKCAGCNQSIADNLYFYDRESDAIYCMRDYAKIRGFHRCRACDELIFMKEYCLAENSTFHVRHFCCYECDQALVGQKYVVEDEQPFCFACFERVKGVKCRGCMRIIKPDEQGAELNGLHFHPTDECFACVVCRKPLLKAKLLLRNERLYCSHDCFNRG